MTRDAVDIIRGYFYQFDYTIKQILESRNGRDNIYIERIEDVDISTATSETAIQCKYYAKTEYNHSVIAKPIRLMLKHFKELKVLNREPIDYLIYGYYESGQHKLTLPISIEFLKNNFLTFTRSKVQHKLYEELDLTDELLQEFLNHLKIDINALEFEIQLSNIFSLLQEIFNCSVFEAEYYYYNNALRLVKDTAINQDTNSRFITKNDLIRIINTKEILFDKWYVNFKGNRGYFRKIRNEHFSRLNSSPFERFFLIDIDQSDYTRSVLKEVIILISSKWGKNTRRTKPAFCPYFMINNLPEEELTKLKTELYEENYNLSDGYVFSNSNFYPDTLLVAPNQANNLKLKFVNKSEHLNETLAKSTRTKEIYQFYFREVFYINNAENIKHIKIQIQDLKNIKEIV